MKIHPFLKASTSLPADNKQRWAYLRISLTRDMQANSLDVQRAQIEDHCLRLGLTLVGVTVDEDSSATEIDFFDRPRVQEMLAAMPEGCRHLVVTKLDRLSRSNTRVGLQTLEDLLGLDFRVTAFDTPTDTSTAAGELQLTIMLAAARFETRRRGERQAETVVSMREHRHRIGSVPYGWDAAPSGRVSKTKRDADDLVPNWKEQTILREILARHARGDNDNEIARWLRAKGERTKKAGQVINGRPVKGKWHAATVQSVREHALLADQPTALAA